MTMASSPSYLFAANANSVQLTCRWACQDANSTDLSSSPYGAAVPNSLIHLSSTQAMSIWYFQAFCVPSQGFVLSYLDGEWPGN